MPPIVYLVSGANRVRGIGFGIVTALAARDNVIVFAGARNPSTATDLQALAEKYPQKIYLVKLVSGDKEGNESAVEQIKTVAGRLDVVIAGAGIADFYAPALETPGQRLLNHFEVNVVGTHVLLQATYPLLQASTSIPKFIALSSTAGSITEGAGVPVNHISYGVSKAALNFLLRKIHFEYKDLICFPLSPGAVYTDMFVEAVAHDESVKAYVDYTISVDKSVVGVIKVIDGSTREKDGGRFMSYDGTTIEW